MRRKKTKKTEDPDLVAGPGAVTVYNWDVWWRRTGGGFNCGAGCTSHSALCQAGS